MAVTECTSVSDLKDRVRTACNSAVVVMIRGPLLLVALVPVCAVVLHLGDLGATAIVSSDYYIS